MIYSVWKSVIFAFLLFGFSSIVSALEAPYLISATVLSDKRIALTSKMSDTSNNLSTITLPRQPSLALSWKPDTSKDVQVILSDSSGEVTGYQLFRADDADTSFHQASQFLSANPGDSGEIQWHDTLISINRWYQYKALVYNNTDSLFSDPCSVFTYYSIPITPAISFEKISEIPLAGANGWSAKVGDSIYFKDSISPANTFTVINVKDPAKPKLDGYIDSSVLAEYPMETLIPIYFKTGVYNVYGGTKVAKYNERVLIAENSTLKMFNVEGDTLAIADFFNLSSSSATAFNINFSTSIDSTIAIQYYSFPAGFGYYKMCLLTQLTSSGIFKVADIMFDMIIQSSSDFSQPAIHGFFNNILLTSISYYIPKGGIRTIIGTSISSNRRFEYTCTMLDSAVVNTGITLTPTASLYTNGAGFFAAHVWDFRGYEAAKKANTIYLDSTHLNDTLRNILADTISKKIYLIYQTALSVLNYYPASSIQTRRLGKNSSSAGKLTIIAHRNSAGITVLFPANARHSELYFYDLNGRLIEKFIDINSNAVNWKPRSRGCYIAMLKYGKNAFSERFMVK
jgi:hypothetical protein